VSPRHNLSEALEGPMSLSDPVPIDFSNAWKQGQRIIDGAITLLPNLMIAVVIFALFVVLAAASKAMVRRLSLKRQHRQNLALLLGQLVQLLLLVLGFLISFSVVAPSFQAGDIVKMLGIGSVAIGFAFQNILQNFLAGVLLLLQEPFTLGDWISVLGVGGAVIEGRVQDIQTRATVVVTQEGKLVIIPNATLYTNPVSVGESKKAVEGAVNQGPSQPSKSS
jgi:small conductance mechanosensitive channel